MTKSSPQPFRFNTHDYYRLAEIGVLRPDARVELINGQIFEMPRPSPANSSAVMRLTHYFGRFSEGRWIVAVHDPLGVDDYSEPEPDFMLLKSRPDYYAKKHPGPDDVFLLIEVSDSSLGFDREEKLPLYGRAGIREVWIVNIAEGCLEVYREPHFEGYASTETLSPGCQARPLAFPDVAVDVAALLRPSLA